MSESATQSSQGESGRTDALFVASAQPKPSAGSILVFILSAVLVFGGFYLMGMAFSVEGAGLWLFSGGLIATVVGFWIPFGLLSGRR